MYLLAKCGGHESYGNGNINSYINFYMITLDAVEFTASICHLRDFQNQEFHFTILKSRTRQGEKKRRRTQAIAKRYAYHSNAKSILFNEII